MEKYKTCPSIQKAGNWRDQQPCDLFICWASHIKLLLPGLEVASNLNDSYRQEFPKLPQPGPEISNSLNDFYIICIARGFPKLPQPGPEMANSTNDLYAIYMTKATSVPSLSA